MARDPNVLLPPRPTFPVVTETKPCKCCEGNTFCCNACGQNQGTPLEFILGPITGFGGSCAQYNGTHLLAQTGPCQWWNGVGGLGNIFLFKHTYGGTNVHPEAWLLKFNAGANAFCYQPCPDVNSSCFQLDWKFYCCVFDSGGSGCINGPGTVCNNVFPASVTLNAVPTQNPLKCGNCCTDEFVFPNTLYAEFFDGVSTPPNEFYSCFNGQIIELERVPIAPGFGNNCHFIEYAQVGTLVFDCGGYQITLSNSRFLCNNASFYMSVPYQTSFGTFGNIELTDNPPETPCVPFNKILWYGNPPFLKVSVTP